MLTVALVLTMLLTGGLTFWHVRAEEADRRERVERLRPDPVTPFPDPFSHR
ncbi:hypothetical protein ACOKM5_21710 [Streptomyces sp. BH097]|uniref:hypothetical protein n=1 Tax=unclassified Streptomyces TaxID=2593676 RepID=UPI003BB6996F